MKTQRIYTCSNLIEAHIIQSRLLSEGIDCFLTNENFTSLMPLYNNMLGSGIQIIVNEDDADAARDILKDKITPDNKLLLCPYCGSKNIGLGLGKNKVFKLFNIISALLLIFPMGNLKPKYYCKDCKKEIN